MQKTRNSSIELLKIIALVFIVLIHASPLYGDSNLISFHDFNAPANNLQEFIMLLFRYCGNFGNLIFVICSSYFLIGKSRPVNKVFRIIIDTVCINWIAVIIFTLFRVDIKVSDIIKSLFPITFELNWFITCYLIFYAIHPLLNFALNNLNKERLLKLNVFFTILYSIIQFIIPGKFFCSNLVSFIIIFFYTAYLKLYLPNFSKNKKINIILLIASFTLHMSLLLITNILGSRFEMFSNQALRWNNLLNPFIIVFCFSLFNIFSTYSFESKMINYISSLSLSFYVIHENYLFRTYIKPLFYQKVFPLGDSRIIWILIEAFSLLVGGLLLAALYKQTIQKITPKIAEKIYNLFNKIYKKVETIILKLN